MENYNTMNGMYYNPAYGFANPAYTNAMYMNPMYTNPVYMSPAPGNYMASPAAPATCPYMMRSPQNLTSPYMWSQCPCLNNSLPQYNADMRGSSYPNNYIPQVNESYCGGFGTMMPSMRTVTLEDIID